MYTCTQNKKNIKSLMTRKTNITFNQLKYVLYLYMKLNELDYTVTATFRRAVVSFLSSLKACITHPPTQVNSAKDGNTPKAKLRVRK